MSTGEWQVFKTGPMVVAGYILTEPTENAGKTRVHFDIGEHKSGDRVRVFCFPQSNAQLCAKLLDNTAIRVGNPVTVEGIGQLSVCDDHALRQIVAREIK